jgi:hypothetical protein
MKKDGIDLYYEQLELLEHSKEQIQRSKSNAGLLFIPESLMGELQENVAKYPNFEKNLMEYLEQPLDESLEANPSVMGFLLKAPSDEQIRHINLDRDPTGEYEASIDARIEKVKEVIAQYEALTLEIDIPTI